MNSIIETPAVELPKVKPAKKPAKKFIAEKEVEEKSAAKVASKPTVKKAGPVKKTAAKKAVRSTVPAGEKGSGLISNLNEKIYRFGKANLKGTNRTKIYFPEEKITKGDVLDYYEKMATTILPYLIDRPQSLFRYILNWPGIEV